MRDNHDSRDLGALGEAEFLRWAAQRGFTATKANPDRNGWDFLAEFRPRADYPNNLQCLIQVKSTDRKGIPRRIRLDNWLRLIDSPLPAFFLILEFDYRNDPQRAFLVHMDEHLTSQGLLRQRQIETESNQSISKATMSLHYDERHRLDHPNALCMEKAIRMIIGSSPAQYVQNKIATRERVGFEDGHHIARITLHNEMPREEFTELIFDAALDLGRPVPVERMEIIETRFGIPSPLPDRVLLSGELSVMPKVLGKADLFFSLGSKRAVLPTEILGMTFPGDPPRSRFRFKNEIIDLRFCSSSKDPEFRLRIPASDTNIPARTWHGFSSLVDILRESNSEAVTFKVQKEAALLFSTEIFLSGFQDSQFTDLAAAAKAAWVTAKHFDIHEEVRPSLSQLMAQREILCSIADLLGPSSIPIEFGSEADSLPLTGRIVMPFGTEVLLGNYRMLLVFSLWSSAEHNKNAERGGPSRFQTYEKHISKSACFEISESAPTLSQFVRSAADSFDDDVICLMPSCYCA